MEITAIQTRKADDGDSVQSGKMAHVNAGNKDGKHGALNSRSVGEWLAHPYLTPRQVRETIEREAEDVRLACWAQVPVEHLRREIARRLVVTWGTRAYVVERLRAEILVGQWPSAKVDILAEADPAGSEWTQ